MLVNYSELIYIYKKLSIADTLVNMGGTICFCKHSKLFNYDTQM
jgi:hypothetical protein